MKKKHLRICSFLQKKKRGYSLQELFLLILDNLKHIFLFWPNVRNVVPVMNEMYCAIFIFISIYC